MAAGAANVSRPIQTISTVNLGYSGLDLTNDFIQFR